MVSTSADTVLTVTICSDAPDGSKHAQIEIAGTERRSERHDGAKKGEHCAFSSLAKVAVGGADAILLSLAFAIILMLGVAAMHPLSVPAICPSPPIVTRTTGSSLTKPA